MSNPTPHAEAQARYRAGDLAGARAFFEAALADDPGHSASHHDLGYLLRQLGDRPGADRHVRASLALAPDLAVGWTTIGLLNGDAGAFPSARQAIDRARLIAPAEPTSLIARADLALDEECRGFADRLITALHRPGLNERMRARLLHALGRLFDRLDDTDRAFDAITAAHAIRRRNQPYDPAEDAAFFASIREACGPEWWARPGSDGHRGIRPIFIVGMPRSGTTMLEQMLSRHPEVTAGGESLALQTVVFAELPQRIGQPFPDCLSVASPDDWTWAAERYLALTADRRAGAAVFTDKLPANFLLVGPILKMFPKARVLNLVRDPLDTALSCYLTDFALGHTYATDLDDLGHHFRLYRALMAHWHALGDRRLRDVRFEAMVELSEVTLRGVLADCGLDWHPDCLAFERSGHATNTASWRRVRGPLDARRVGRWRRYERRLGRLAGRLASPSGTAADVTRRTLAWEPSRPAETLTTIEIALARGDHDRARRDLGRLAALAGADPRLLMRAAGTAERAGEPDLARGLIAAASRAAPGSAAIHANLAVAHGRAGALPAAIRSTRRALLLAPAAPEAWSNLGNFLAGDDPAGAVTAHRRATVVSPDDPGLHGNLSLALLRIAGGAPAAERALRRVLALEPGDRAHGMSLYRVLSATGRAPEGLAVLDRLRCSHPLDAEVQYERGCALRDADRDAEAVTALKRALVLAPEFTAWRHVLDALLGHSAAATPVDYVRELFDQYAEQFDDHLTARLHYRTPETLADALARSRPDLKAFGRVLDLGCGTGLMGPALRRHFAVGHMTGVDLSSAMLAKLVEKGGYDETAEADIHDFLERADTPYDLIVAADVLVYFGALERVMAGARRALAPGGVVALSVEEGDNAPFELRRNGRYAHRRDYLEAAAAAAGLRPLLFETAELRQEGGKPVVGLLVVLTA